MKTMPTDDMAKQLIEAKEAYYTGSPIMSDAAFDEMEEKLRDINPKHSYFKVVGSPITNSKTKFKHVIPMLSAGKTKTAEEVREWAKKMGIGPKDLLLAEPKIDGLSGTCIYENGKLTTVATRGDGEIGQDITHVTAYIKIPKTIDIAKGRIEVRGEFYLPKKNSITKERLRNTAVGLINRKDDGIEDLKHVRFVAYQVHGSQMDSEGYKMSWLDNNGFEVIKCKLLSVDEVEAYNKNYLDHLREAWPYETDGQIYVVNDNTRWAAIDAKREVEHHHHYMIALKPPAEGKQTVLLGIEWNVSRQGKVVPVGLFKPVTLGDAKVQRATLNNFENVEKLGLFEGDDIFIEKANDVIPFFKENLSARQKGHPSGYDKSLVPTKCPSCKDPLHRSGVHLICANPDCAEQNILKIVHWVKQCKMEFFGESSVRALFAAGKIKNIHSLYSLKESDLQGLDSFGDSRIKNTLKQIAETKEMTINEFIDRLGIESVGERAVTNMGIKSVPEMWAFKNPNDMSVGRHFTGYIRENKDFVKEVLEEVTIIAPKVKAKGAKSIAMTGKGPDGRDALAKKIEANGDVFSEHVGKDTDILLCEDTKGSSSKLAKAAKMGVKLMTYAEYFK